MSAGGIVKVCHFIYSLDNGGAEKLTVELCNFLSKKVEVGICSFTRVEDTMIPPKNLSRTVALIELNVKNKYSVNGLVRLFKFVYRYRPEVLHIHSSLLMFYFMIISLFYKKGNYIQTVHNTITPGYAKQFNFLRFLPWMYKRLINVCISESIHNFYQRFYPRFIFRHIDNGIDRLRVSPQHERVKTEIEYLKKNIQTKVFVSIGNYSVFKNFTMLARVFKRLETEGYNVSLIIIGGDSSPEKLNSKSVEHEKGLNTSLVGLKTNIPDYLYHADALIVSSTKEGMPLVVLEALSMGLPIVSTPVGGVTDCITDGLNGYLAEDFSEGGLFNAVCRFLSTPRRITQDMMKRNRLLFNEKYSMEICAKNYENLYRIN